MDALIVALHFAVAHKIAVMMVMMGLALPAIVIAKKRRTAAWSAVAVLIVAFAFGNMFFGQRLLGRLLDAHGEHGTGTIVAVHDTRSRMNGQPVKRYDALIRAVNGSTVEARFDGFSLPLHPAPGEGYLFPQPGVEFQVSYLPSQPQVFVIRTDGASAYAQGLRCAGLARALSAAKQRAVFARASAQYRTAHARAIDAYTDAGCIASPDLTERMRAQARALRGTPGTSPGAP
ncbi:hypothetical protein [Lysobacter sp. FW306-1B-D06B]|uniref:hypothetical protein n=1 Tax=Lysobacter sp. FW306-1B-D06B TaxID=3140250 RepID=UPI003140A2D7